MALRPRDPYLADLKGQILLEGRRPQDAVAAYRRATELGGRNALILGGYGRALLAAGQTEQAIRVLERARAQDFRAPRVLRDLASAHAQAGQIGQAALATAERYALAGRMRDASMHAKRAQALLPEGSAAWQRAMDVLAAARRAG